MTGVYAAFIECGFTGCQGGLRSVPLPLLVVVLWLISGAILATPIALIRWAPWGVRKVIAVVVTLAWAGFWFFFSALG
ncbi:hypothetical protein CLV92_1322 [Kineococcus xinjiangensis]|uniref:Uncharacterized protein n=1 Tax=Kineococcus xinjiangensis TaxID=512762 RepID=A0A2S6IBX1_9ACTN|nr:hypothetical protein CLV92_1322 [Kineococcus xinjiangensis]